MSRRLVWSAFGLIQGSLGLAYAATGRWRETIGWMLLASWFGFALGLSTAKRRPSDGRAS